jgi:hypothetical protein
LLAHGLQLPGVVEVIEGQMKCHACDYVLGSWSLLVKHRAAVHPDDYVNGLPFWMLEERLTDKEYAILWMMSSKAARKDLGPHNHRCWGPDIIGA